MREMIDHAINTGVHRRINYEKVSSKQENGGNHDSRRGADLFPRRPGDTPHLGFHFFYIRLCLPGPSNGLTYFHMSN